MSIEAMVGALNHSKAQGAAHIVLLNIANHQGEQGAWPSIPTLARLAKVSDRRVQQILNELVDMGELKIDARAAGYGSIKTNRYWVTISCPATCDGTFAHRVVKSVSLGGEADFTGGVKPVSLAGEVDFTQNNIEPKKEPVKEPLAKKPQLLKDDWLPDQRLVEMFSTKWPLLNMGEQTEAFKLHHMAKGSKMADWSLAYQKWMNQAQKWAAEKQPAEKPRPKILGDWR
jgi:hypothetical protein